MLWLIAAITSPLQGAAMMRGAHGPVRGIVESVEDLSPTFRMITFSGPELHALATEGPFYDQRIKLILPNAAGALPRIPESEDWYQQWLALPDDERGIMRTYSIRDLTRQDNVTRLTVDFVLHFADDGSTGPAAAWAAGVEVGAELLLVAPRHGQPQSGIEFSPGHADEVVLLGDESAAPAIARIVEDIKTFTAAPRACASVAVTANAEQPTIACPSTLPETPTSPGRPAGKHSRENHWPMPWAGTSMTNLKRQARTRMICCGRPQFFRHLVKTSLRLPHHGLARTTGLPVRAA